MALECQPWAWVAAEEWEEWEVEVDADAVDAVVAVEDPQCPTPTLKMMIPQIEDESP